MGTYYYIVCDQCRQRLPLWGRWAHSCGLLLPGRDDPDTVQSFINEHLRHGISIIDEDSSRMVYECDFEDER